MNERELSDTHLVVFADAGVPLPACAVALLAAAILLVVGLVGNSAQAQPTDVRTLTVRGAPDGSYRAQPNWEANLGTNVAAGRAGEPRREDTSVTRS